MITPIKMTLALASATLAMLASAGVAEVTQVPVVRLHQQVEIAAPDSAIWPYMTQGKNLVTWCPEWKAPANTVIDITRVGDVLDFTDQWGNNGRSIVTYLVKGKELRVAHEPNKGDYICQAKLLMAPTAKGTMVHYWEQYTDESTAEDLQATARKMDSEMLEALMALKASVEAISKP